jgi:hypothetical protein
MERTIPHLVLTNLFNLEHADASVAVEPRAASPVVRVPIPEVTPEYTMSGGLLNGAVQSAQENKEARSRLKAS